MKSKQFLYDKMDEMYQVMSKAYPQSTPAEIYGMIADELDAILAVKEFNRFAREAASHKEFRKIQDYAINGYFQKQGADRKQAIAASYARIENNTASRHDMELVMDYWNACRKEFEGNAGSRGTEGNVV